MIKTYVAIVLDRSGSMKDVKEETVKGYNEQVKVLQEEASIPDRETFVSLVTFNGEVKEDLFNCPVDMLTEMRSDQYNPVGWTAMYDGVGYTIDKLCKETDVDDPNNSYLIIIISDGKENRSKYWRGGLAFHQRIVDNKRDLSAKVKELQDTNRWTFTYIGSNQDLAKVRAEMNLHVGNTIAYNSSKSGTKDAFVSNSQQMKKYLSARGKSQNYSTDLYFEDAKTIDELKEKQ